MGRTDTQSGETEPPASLGRKILLGLLILVGLVVGAYIGLIAIFAISVAMQSRAAGSDHVDVL